MLNVAEADAKGNIVEGTAIAAPHGQELRPGIFSLACRLRCHTHHRRQKPRTVTVRSF